MAKTYVEFFRQENRDLPPEVSQEIEVTLEKMGMTRGYAAYLLERVAEEGEHGCFPSEVSCEELGQAIFRLAMNASEPEPHKAVVRGIELAAGKFFDSF